jgi:hypothetical protein
VDQIIDNVRGKPGCGKLGGTGGTKKQGVEMSRAWLLARRPPPLENNRTLDHVLEECRAPSVGPIAQTAHQNPRTSAVAE